MNRRNKLHTGVQFSLFATSYTPLFILIILRQITSNFDYIKWGDLNFESIKILIEKFGLTIILSMLIIFGAIGIYLSLKNIANEARANGVVVQIVDVKNRNAEAISYIGTYIIPFLFQNYSDWYSFISISFLLFVIYKIYVNSSLLLINPLLNMRYSLFEIEFVDDVSSGIKKQGLLITREKFLEDNDQQLIHNIGQKLYYGEKYAE